MPLAATLNIAVVFVFTLRAGPGKYHNREPDEPRSIKAFDPSIKSETDRSAYRFVKR